MSQGAMNDHAFPGQGFIFFVAAEYDEMHVRNVRFGHVDVVLRINRNNANGFIEMKNPRCFRPVAFLDIFVVRRTGKHAFPYTACQGNFCRLVLKTGTGTQRRCREKQIYD